MQILAAIIKALAACFRVLPIKRRVAFLSRQSAKPSLDYRLLIDELTARIGDDAVVTCLIEPETRNVASFALGTVRQLYYASTSKVVVIDSYIPAVSIPKKDERVTVIQMWHALGAVKKFGYQCLDTPAGRTSESARAGRMHRNYDYIIAGGPGAREAYAAAFDYKPERIVALGLPRIDYLLDAGPACARAAAMQQAREAYPFLDEGKRIVLYAPTLRKGEEYGPDWLTGYVRQIAQEIAGGIDAERTLLVVAAHPLSGEFDEALLDEFPFIRTAPGVPTIDLLGFADEVVSDYSSVIFEAGILGKPVRCFAPDAERYRTSPGLNIEPERIDQAFLDAYFDEITPGATARIADLVERKLSA